MTTTMSSFHSLQLSPGGNETIGFGLWIVDLGFWIGGQSLESGVQRFLCVASRTPQMISIRSPAPRGSS